MKKEIKGFLVCLMLLGAIGAGRKYVWVQKVYQNEGDTLNGISVTCTNAAWTAVAAANAKRRSAVFHTLTSAADSVCISTATAGPCVDGMPGYEVEAGASVSDFSEALLNCRTRSSNVVVKGMIYTDSED